MARDAAGEVQLREPAHLARADHLAVSNGLVVASGTCTTGNCLRAYHAADRTLAWTYESRATPFVAVSTIADCVIYASDQFGDLELALRTGVPFSGVANGWEPWYPNCPTAVRVSDGATMFDQEAARLVAIVADPGMSDPWSAWPAVVRDIAQAGDAAAQNLEWQQSIIPELTPSEPFTIKKRGAIFATKFLDEARAGQMPSDYALISTTMEKFNCLPVAEKVRTPTLVTRYEGDQFVEPQAQIVYDKLRQPKQLTSFTVAEGADFHCVPMAPQYRNEVVFDWLAPHLDH